MCTTVFQVEAIEKYFDEQVGLDLPKEVQDELVNLKNRITNMD